MSYQISFVATVPDVPAFERLLRDYYDDVLQIAEAAGMVGLSAAEMVRSSIEHLDEMLPPDGRLALAHDAEGQLVGCGAFRRIRPDAAEMKRMYVRPEARRSGLGRKLVEMRIEEARQMGCRFLYADTVKGNRPMLAMYEAFGFRTVPRYPGNANPPEYAPYLVYLEYSFPA